MAGQEHLHTACKCCVIVETIVRVLNCSCSQIRVVSICDTKARFLSANFSHGYFKRVPMREDEIGEEPTIMEVNIGRYYDMHEKEEFLQFMKQLIDVPNSPSFVR